MAMDVVCLFEESGLSAQPWLEDGHDVHCYDILNTDHMETHGAGRVFWHRWDAHGKVGNDGIIERHMGNTMLVLAYPPCTDLAVSGAAWFAAKKEKNQRYREEAMSLVYKAKEISDRLRVPYCIENPVSVISSEWRKPDFIFHPYEFGGYLPEDDVHPEYPEYIAARDGYTKKTCYWTGNGFVAPEKDPIEPEPNIKGGSRQHRLLGGKSAKTKRIRSLSPRGVALAIRDANDYLALL